MIGMGPGAGFSPRVAPAVAEGAPSSEPARGGDAERATARFPGDARRTDRAGGAKPGKRDAMGSATDATPGEKNERFDDLLQEQPAQANAETAVKPAPSREDAEWDRASTRPPEQWLAMLDGVSALAVRVPGDAANAADGAAPAALPGAALPGSPATGLTGSVGSTLQNLRSLAPLSTDMLPSPSQQQPGAGSAMAARMPAAEPAFLSTLSASADATALAAGGLSASAAAVAGAFESLPGATPDNGALTALADASSGIAASSDNAGLLPPSPTASLQTGSAVRTVPGAPMTMPPSPQDGFEDGFGARLAWMAEQRVGHAEIRLNPENLGPIDVRVQLDGTRVHAEFHSAHAEVRQALEASVPKLREMLGQHGLQLGQTDVGQRHAGAGHAGNADRAMEGSDDPAAPMTATRPLLRTRGLVDEYA